MSTKISRTVSRSTVLFFPVALVSLMIGGCSVLEEEAAPYSSSQQQATSLPAAAGGAAQRMHTQSHHVHTPNHS